MKSSDNDTNSNLQKKRKRNRSITLEEIKWNVFESNSWVDRMFTGIIKVTILNKCFLYPFSGTYTITESRSQTPIHFKIAYREENNIKLSIQIGGEKMKEEWIKQIDDDFRIVDTENPVKEYQINIESTIITETNLKYNTVLTNREEVQEMIIPIDEQWINGIKETFWESEKCSMSSNSDALEEGKIKQIKIFFNIHIEKNSNLIEKVPFSGWVNEGNTCYMNSLLQIWFMLKYFKESIFNVRISKNNIETSKIYSIQKLFYEIYLTKGEHPVQTTNWIHSFGWNEHQLYIQNDIQEFFITLAGIMENELKNTKEENTFKHLFEGKIMTKIKCWFIDFQSEREETFTDIQWPIKNCKDIYASFDKYIEKEIWDGANQYDTEKEGKQDAHKVVKFSEMPKVLVLQLIRFELNTETNEFEKINDRFEYYEHIDLGKYSTCISKDDPKSMYELHGVVVHSGNINGGHYVSYTKHEVITKENKTKKQWFKFNDSKVNSCGSYEVLNNNYGGESTLFGVNANKPPQKPIALHDEDSIYEDPWEYIDEMKTLSPSSAYILVYIRKDSLTEMIGSFNINNIPQYTIDLFNYEKRLREKIENRNYRRQHFVNLNIITKEILDKNNGIGIIENYYHDNNDDSLIQSRYCINVFKSLKLKSIVQFIADNCNVSPSKIYLYKYEMDTLYSHINRYNYKMTYLSQEDYDGLAIENVWNWKCHVKCYWFVYVDSDAKWWTEQIINNVKPRNDTNNKDEELNDSEEIVYSINKENNSAVDMNTIDNKIYFTKHSNYWTLFRNWNSFECNTDDIKNTTTSGNNNRNDLKICNDNFMASLGKTKNIEEDLKVQNDFRMNYGNNMNQANSNNCLLIIKLPHYTYSQETSSFNILFTTSKIFQINEHQLVNEVLSKKELKRMLLNNFSSEFINLISHEIENSEVQYLIEYPSLSEYIENENHIDFKPSFPIKSNQCLQNFKNNCYWIIVSLVFQNPIIISDSNSNNLSFSTWRELNDKYLSSLILTVHSDFVFSSRFSHKINWNTIDDNWIIKPFTFDLSTEIKEIKKRIMKSLISNKGSKLLQKWFTNGLELYNETEFIFLNHTDFNIIKHNANPNRQRFKNPNIYYWLDFFIEDNYDIIELEEIPFMSNTNLKKSYLNRYEILKYINSMYKTMIEFKVNLDKIVLLPYSEPGGNTQTQSIILTDMYCNPIVNLFIPWQKNKNQMIIESVDMIIKSVYDDIYWNSNLSKYFDYTPKALPSVSIGTHNNSSSTTWSKENSCDEDYVFIFINYQPITYVAYDILELKNEIEGHNVLSEICYKPYRTKIDYDSYFQSNNKIFVTFYSEDFRPLCLPCIFRYPYNEVTIGQFKDDMIKYCEQVHALKKWLNRNYKIMFYKCKWIKMSPVSLSYISQYNDKDTLLKIYNQKLAFNIMIQICNELDSKQNKSNALGICE